ncbi:MAG: cyclic nucleotide-binding domain-containing protein [Alphaproteobacteria bacterium]|nr:cyclic nucleotide-binding domain-containing protein [Alphaproteobacteria bacterium]
MGTGGARADLRRLGRRHSVGDRRQVANPLLSLARGHHATRRSRRLDVLHLERRVRSPTAERRHREARRGAFFGEMSLLERQPRSATVATSRPTTLLALYASDFYEIASRIPALAEAVEVEAKRRREENLERRTGEPKR